MPSLPLSFWALQEALRVGQGSDWCPLSLQMQPWWKLLEPTMSRKSAGEYRTPGLALPCRRPEWGGALALVVMPWRKSSHWAGNQTHFLVVSESLGLLWPRSALRYLKVESQPLCHFFWPQTALIPQLFCSSEGVVWDPSYILWVPWWIFHFVLVSVGLAMGNCLLTGWSAGGQQWRHLEVWEGAGRDLSARATCLWGWVPLWGLTAFLQLP